MTLFRRELPRRPLLTIDQEQALARRIQGEDVAVPPPGPSRPSPAEARDRLVEQTLPLVISVAQTYRYRGVPIEELVQEGALGLQRAAETFAPGRGATFATYAIWWVRKAMAQAVGHESRPIRLPENVVAELARLGRAEDELRTRLGRHPTEAQLAAHVGVEAARVAELRLLSRSALSLDAGRDDREEGGGALGDAIPDPTPSVGEQLERTWLCQDVQRALAAL